MVVLVTEYLAHWDSSPRRAPSSLFFTKRSEIWTENSTKTQNHFDQPCHTSVSNISSWLKSLLIKLITSDTQLRPPLLQKRLGCPFASYFTFLIGIKLNKKRRDTKLIARHGTIPRDLTENITVLRKCKGKFECLLYEMLFIQKEKPPLNIQSDSLRAKLFI